MEADGGLGEDVELAADEGGIEGSARIECAEDGLVFGVDIDHLGFTEIGIVEGEDADYVAVGVVFGLYLSIYDQELEFFFYDQEPEYFFTTRNQRTGVILNVEFWILN